MPAPRYTPGLWPWSLVKSAGAIGAAGESIIIFVVDVHSAETIGDHVSDYLFHQAIHVLGVPLPVTGREALLGPPDGDQHILAGVLQRLNVVRIGITIRVEGAALSCQIEIITRNQEGENDIRVGQVADPCQGYRVRAAIIVDDITRRYGTHDFPPVRCCSERAIT
jgi:hypothetical protein